MKQISMELLLLCANIVDPQLQWEECESTNSTAIAVKGVGDLEDYYLQFNTKLGGFTLTKNQLFGRKIVAIPTDILFKIFGLVERYEDSNEVFVAYSTDKWYSKDSRIVIGVATSFEKVIELLKRDAIFNGYDFVSFEESFIKSLSENQYTDGLHKKNEYVIEVFPLN